MSPRLRHNNTTEPRRGDRFRLRHEPQPSAQYICRRSAAFQFFLIATLGLTPQAKYLSPLRGSIRCSDFQRVAQSFRRIAVGHDARVVDLNINRANFAQHLPKSRTRIPSFDDPNGHISIQTHRMTVLAAERRNVMSLGRGPRRPRPASSRMAL